MHSWPGSQACPQPPQLRMSLSRLAQPLMPQQVCPMPQAMPLGGQPQWPPRQIIPVPQVVVQSPQWRGSLEVSWKRLAGITLHLGALCRGRDPWR